MNVRVATSGAEEGAPDAPRPSEREAVRGIDSELCEPEPEPDTTTHGGAPTRAADRQLDNATTTTHGGAPSDGSQISATAEICNERTGISLGGLLHVVDLLGAGLTAETTTSDVCHAHIKPLTTPAGWTDEAKLINAEKRWYEHSYVHAATGERRDQKHPPPGTRSMCVQLASESETSHFVGRPTHFLSQAWQYKFLNLVEALRCFVESQPEGSQPVFFWFCCFATDEHAPHTVPLRTVFQDSIRRIGHTVMVISPWNDPVVLKRAWCLWELFCTVQVGVPFSVCLGPAEAAAFEAAILDPDSCMKILDAFARIDVGAAEAGNPQDKAMILEQARSSAGGLEGLNAVAVSTLRRWFVDFVVRLGWRARAQGRAEGAVAMRRVADALTEMGVAEEAMKLYEAAVTAYEAAGDEESAAGARAGLGSALMTLKRYAEAQPLIEAVLAFGTEQGAGDEGADEHEQAMRMMRLGLANCMEATGDLKGAIREREALARSAPTDDVFGIRVRYALASSYMKAGDLDKAVREFRTVVEGHSATFGPRHAETLMAQAHLASARLAQGNVADAMALLEVAVPALEAMGFHGAPSARQLLEVARQRSVPASAGTAEPEPEPA